MRPHPAAKLRLGLVPAGHGDVYMYPQKIYHTLFIVVLHTLVLIVIWLLHVLFSHVLKEPMLKSIDTVHVPLNPYQESHCDTVGLKSVSFARRDADNEPRALMDVASGPKMFLLCMANGSTPRGCF